MLKNTRHCGHLGPLVARLRHVKKKGAFHILNKYFFFCKSKPYLPRHFMWQISINGSHFDYDHWGVTCPGFVLMWQLFKSF